MRPFFCSNGFDVGSVSRLRLGCKTHSESFVFFKPLMKNQNESLAQTDRRRLWPSSSAGLCAGTTPRCVSLQETPGKVSVQEHKEENDKLAKGLGTVTSPREGRADGCQASTGLLPKRRPTPRWWRPHRVFLNSGFRRSCGVRPASGPGLIGTPVSRRAPAACGSTSSSVSLLWLFLYRPSLS